jgi:predicted transcriptional regulator
MPRPQAPTTTSIRLPKDLVRQLQVIADAHERSITAEAKVALAEYIKHHGTTRKAK